MKNCLRKILSAVVVCGVVTTLPIDAEAATNDVVISQQTTPSTPVPEGTASLSYRLEIVNNTSSKIRMKVFDYYDPNFTYQSASPTPKTHSTSQRKLKWVFRLNAGATKIIDVFGAIDPASCDYTLVNNVKVYKKNTLLAQDYNYTFVECDQPDPEADLSVTKTDFPDPAEVSSSLFYTVTAHNIGPDAADHVQLVDYLPFEAAFISASPGTVYDASNHVVSLSAGTIAAGANQAMIIEVMPLQDGQLRNDADVSSSTADPNPANNSISEFTVVNAPVTNPPILEADLAVAIQDSADPVEVGHNLIYTITADNLGPDSSANVEIKSFLPPEASFSWAQYSCVYDAPSHCVTCDLGTMVSGASTQVQIYVIPQQAGTLRNDVDISGDTADPNAANDTDTEFTTVSSTPTNPPEWLVDLDVYTSTPVVDLSQTNSLPAGSVVYIIGSTDASIDPMQQSSNMLIAASTTGDDILLGATTIDASGLFSETVQIYTSQTANAYVRFFRHIGEPVVGFAEWGESTMEPVPEPEFGVSEIEFGPLQTQNVDQFTP